MRGPKRCGCGHIIINVWWVAQCESLFAQSILDDPEGDEGQEGSTYLSMLDPELRGRLHVTVGTRDAPVLPFEEGALDESFEKGEKGLNKLRLGEDSWVSKVKEVQVVTIRFSSGKSSGRPFFQFINHSDIFVCDTFILSSCTAS
jgi:hypothetical protein